MFPWKGLGQGCLRDHYRRAGVVLGIIELCRDIATIADDEVYITPKESMAGFVPPCSWQCGAHLCHGGDGDFFSVDGLV